MYKFSNLIANLKKKITADGSKKVIQNTVIVAIIGIILLIAGSVFFQGTDKNEEKVPPQTENGTEAVETLSRKEGETKDELEKSLEAILSQIKGAGKVSVMVTFYSGSESVPVYNTKNSTSDTQEKDKEGGTRSVKQADRENNIIFEESDGVKKPYITKELLPKVKGVVIVADGAKDAEVRSSLAKATEALFEVASHKIQVFERNKN
ncbi:stage III sporulation protein AG [Ruminiclostridium cellulolyticum]|uniref:Stage III sporulation protein AG n=1 Tax=Ruminiclostridium cellulolyticum (strain ATCC 35319 / DSM 5812 / JCM 6584 / H10) TaxID=394503 RepID=B8I3B5_RUMCH|nr:stage III sporulation protein AG [Ruminiclostridium cellulolyticum]ACL76258.1 stage III sporulation protein AG [Ruminiclostridium cellulolyticum H10]